MAEATFQHVRVTGKNSNARRLFSTTCGLKTVRPRIAKCSTAAPPPKHTVVLPGRGGAHRGNDAKARLASERSEIVRRRGVRHGLPQRNREGARRDDLGRMLSWYGFTEKVEKLLKSVDDGSFRDPHAQSTALLFLLPYFRAIRYISGQRPRRRPRGL